MTEILNINDGELISLKSVRKLSVISEKDQESLASLGDHVDASRFQTRIDFADGSKTFAPETAQQIAAQGVALVEVGDGSFVPAINIVKARNLTDTDRTKFETRTGRPLRADFASRVETKAGAVLASVDAETVMHRLAHPGQGF